jgi:hypothetical protein
MAGAGLRRRIGAASAASAAAGGCPGPGVVNRLAAGGDPEPPPCPACGGCHVQATDEVLVVAEPPGPEA